ERPHVRAAAALPTVAPGLVVRLSGLRDGLELPKLLAGDDIEGARVAGIAVGHGFRARRADDRDVLVDRRRCAVTGAHGDAAVLAEARHGLARRGVDGHEI